MCRFSVHINICAPGKCGPIPHNTPPVTSFKTLSSLRPPPDKKVLIHATLRWSLWTFNQNTALKWTNYEPTFYGNLIMALAGKVPENGWSKIRGHFWILTYTAPPKKKFRKNVRTSVHVWKQLKMVNMVNLIRPQPQYVCHCVPVVMLTVAFNG